MNRPKSLHEVLAEHTTVRSESHVQYRIFKDSGHVYRDVRGLAIDNHARTFIPVIDNIERADLRITGAPYDAIAALLKREGKLS